MTEPQSPPPIPAPEENEEVRRLQEDGWSLTREPEALKREFRFANFPEAFAFMTQIAIQAESVNHHPEWKNVWNRVEITWTTHDAGGISALDLEMAAFCDRLFARHGS